MRISMTLLAAFIALGIGCSAQAENCDANQASMNTCAANKLAALDADLNKQYKAQMAWLQTPAKAGAQRRAAEVDSPA